MPPQKSRLKRLPSHSYSIILKFESDTERDKFINSSEFDKVYKELTSLTKNYNIRLEIIHWNSITGSVKS
ncbi:MAG: hypothetical protein ACFFBP_03530 [Promethearchaeota archaeon]